MNNLILDYYGFSHYPFSKEISNKNIFVTQSHKEVLGLLEVGIQSEDIILLSGEIGVGKSVALRYFSSTIDSNCYHTIYLRGINFSQGELYKIILESLQIDPPHFTDKAKRLYFKKIPELSKKPVIIIDDAQELKDSALSGIKAMVNFDCDSKTKIIFVLSGQPDLISRIKLAQFYSLRQRIKLFFEMTRMTLVETCQYIDHHTKICNNPNPIFSDGAKTEIYNRSKGIARKINAICYNAIAYGAANKYKVIDSSNLVFSDLIDD